MPFYLILLIKYPIKVIPGSGDVQGVCINYIFIYFEKKYLPGWFYNLHSQQHCINESVFL